MNFFARNLQIFKRIGLPLFVLTLIYTSLDQLLTINIDASLRSTAGGNMGMIWAYGFLSLIIGILFPILGILIVVYGASEPATSELGLMYFIEKHVNQVSIEILRSWGKTLLWSLALILPGMWKYVEFTMIPFVVMLSPGYQRGEQDALEASSRVVKQRLGKIILILILFHLILPSLLTVFFDDYRLVWQTPVSALFLTLLDVYIFIISTQLLIEVFEENSVIIEGSRGPDAESYV